MILDAHIHRVTLALLCYNQLKYLPEAIDACLQQECEPIEILLSDDASIDGSYAYMLERAAAYQGPHSVRVRRNTRNLGIGGHYTVIANESHGELIVTAAADDISLPHRVQKLIQAWDTSQCQAQLITSHVLDMDDTGHIHGILRVDDLNKWQTAKSWCLKRPYVIGAAHAFNKNLLLNFPALSEKLCFEDQVMAFRASHLNAGILVDEPLVKYRRGGISHRRKTFPNPQELAAANWRRHEKQVTLYQQIHADLQYLQFDHLWGGKPRRLLLQHTAAMRLLAANNLREKLYLLYKQGRQVGWRWMLRYTWRYRDLHYSTTPNTSHGGT